MQEYRLCTKSYLADGKDGYDVFKSCKQLVREHCVIKLNSWVNSSLVSLMWARHSLLSVLQY